jgi:hypothetical protein
MHVTAPSSARQGERVTISISGAPAGTEQIKFNATGNSGFDIISTTSGSASFNLSLDFSGTTSVEILAQDKFGATLASATHSISVKDTSFDARGAANRRLGGTLSAVAEAVAGTVTEVFATGGDGAEQVEFSASNAEMGWMMPVPITPGGSASTTVKLTTEGMATIFATFTDKAGAVVAKAEHAIRVVADTSRRHNAHSPRRYGFGGSLSGISEAVIGTMTDIMAQAGDGVEQVEFSASNAEMGWMMPVNISPGGSTSASVKLTSEGTATIYANFKDALGNIKGAAQHIIRVTAAPQNRPQTGPRLGMGGSLSGIAEAIKGTITEVYAQGSGEAEQVEFSVSNAEMGWMMPVNISPGGSTSASVTLSSEGTATIFANFKDKMGNLLGTAQHLIRVLPDTTRSQGPTDMAGLMNARAADILNRLGRKP